MGEVFTAFGVVAVTGTAVYTGYNVISHYIDQRMDNWNREYSHDHRASAVAPNRPSGEDWK